jgi:site-specific DNA-methyltransferase (adenine-specific)
MRKKVIGGCSLYLGTMEETIGGIEHVDHILTDPPYLYIKTHDFDKEFNEQLFFENAKRHLSDDGFIALFGRGTSFYRWNTRLADLGFVFKEEIVWDKKMISSPVSKISRVHETLSIHTKKNGKIKISNIPYVEQRQNNIEGIINDIKRIKSAINSGQGIDNILDFLNTRKLKYSSGKNNHKITKGTTLACLDPSTAMFRSMINGIREKTIISVFPVHYGSVHPTEKPVRLAERILALISDPGDTIYDPFMGSGSFGVACIRTGRKYIGSEMKPEYFDIACNRIKKEYNQLPLAEGY